ncbi:MAG: sigma-70 family RNA polymerase sigma factor [Solirubrobacteraceae bacterium]
MYRDHSGAVRSFARRRAESAVADDLAAEVFLIAWRRLDEIPADPLPWLLTVARGLLSNLRRGDARRSAMLERAAARAVASPFASASDPGDDPAVIRALGQLRESDQELLMLIAWDGLDRRQAAELLNVSVGTLAVRLHRARRRFVAALADHDRVQHATESKSAAVEVSR